MPRPNMDRVRVTLFLAKSGVDAITKLAKQRGEPPAEIYRAVFKAGYPIVASETPPAANPAAAKKKNGSQPNA